jgi:hypothetical protein
MKFQRTHTRVDYLLGEGLPVGAITLVTYTDEDNNAAIDWCQCLDWRQVTPETVLDAMDHVSECWFLAKEFEENSVQWWAKVRAKASKTGCVVLALCGIDRASVVQKVKYVALTHLEFVDSVIVAKSPVTSCGMYDYIDWPIKPFDLAWVRDKQLSLATKIAVDIFAQLADDSGPKLDIWRHLSTQHCVPKGHQLGLDCINALLSELITVLHTGLIGYTTWLRDKILSVEGYWCVEPIQELPVPTKTDLNLLADKYHAESFQVIPVVNWLLDQCFVRELPQVGRMYMGKLIVDVELLGQQQPLV